MRNTVWKI